MKRIPRVVPDGLVKERVHFVKDIYSDALNADVASHIVHWFAAFPNSQAQDDRYNTQFSKANQQFDAMIANYTWYRVYGVSIRVLPYILYPNQAGGQDI